MRKFIVGAYWGGLVAISFGLLPVIVFRPRFLSTAALAELPQLTPALVLAGFALLTSVLAAGTMVILRELAAVRAAIERGASLPASMQTRLSSWATAPSHPVTAKATLACPACARTNWTEAYACVDCGTALSCDSPVPAPAH